MADDDYQDVPARRAPYPASVSEAARASLRSWYKIPRAPYPAPDDTQAWLQLISQIDRATLERIWSREAFAPEKVESEAVQLGGAAAYRINPKSGGVAGRVLLDIHGGAFTNGAGPVCEANAITSALDFDALVFAVDYRMPPLHPYPAGVDDCVAAYRAVLEAHAPGEIVVRGLSAGANLAAALILRARDEGLPLPAAALLLTPELDLTESGDSFQTNSIFDVVLKRSLMQPNLLYAGGHDPTHPYLSPLFGDFATGFPPTLLTAGTRDMFLSNAARMHNALRRAGNYSELIVEEAMPHGGFFGSPEDDALLADIKDFAERAWAGGLPRARLGR